MEFVRSIANKVTVLHEGKVLKADATVAEVQADATVQEVYIGRARDDRNSVSRGGAATADAGATAGGTTDRTNDTAPTNEEETR